MSIDPNQQQVMKHVEELRSENWQNHPNNKSDIIIRDNDKGTCL
jgi:hypothetical protein